jgi:hypothetical protein
MKEFQFGFEYSWSDLQPIRPLVVTMFAAQVLGALLGLWAAVYPSWFANVYGGGALITFPSFLLGLLVQSQVDRTRMREHPVMVRRVGLIALVLSLSVFVMPLNEF